MNPRPNNEIYAVVKQYADAWAANDLRAIVDCYHDEVVFHYFGHSPLAGTHRGKVACLGLQQFERNGATVEIERLLRYRVRDGKWGSVGLRREPTPGR